LTDADAEQLETQHWLDVAVCCGYLDPARGFEIGEKLKEIGRMLHSMIGKANSFCGEVREGAATYGRSARPTAH
jgi:hypothetical protein